MVLLISYICPKRYRLPPFPLSLSSLCAAGWLFLLTGDSFPTTAKRACSSLLVLLPSFLVLLLLQVERCCWLFPLAGERITMTEKRACPSLLLLLPSFLVFLLSVRQVDRGWLLPLAGELISTTAKRACSSSLVLSLSSLYDAGREALTISTGRVVVINDS